MSAKDTLCQMLKTLGFEATVTEQNYEDMLLLDIQTDEPNRLIGRQGQTLGEIQYLLNRILHKETIPFPESCWTWAVTGERPGSNWQNGLLNWPTRCADMVTSWRWSL